MTTTATFDGVSSGVAISNGDLTVTNAAGSGLSGARSAVNKSTGKYYFEVTVAAWSGANDAFGILKSVGTYTDMVSQLNSFSVIRQNGLVYIDGVFFANTGTVTNGMVLCFAFDLTSRNGWVRPNNTIWNNNFGADPAGGFGGGALPATVDYAPAAIFSGGVDGDNVTANFGETPYAFSPPSGFGNWPASGRVMSVVYNVGMNLIMDQA